MEYFECRERGTKKKCESPTGIEPKTFRSPVEHSKHWATGRLVVSLSRHINCPGGYFRRFRIGVCRQGSQTLTLFKGRKSRIDTLLKAQNQEMAPYLRETR